MVTKGDGNVWGEINQEFGINRYTLLQVKQVNNKDVLTAQEAITQHLIKPMTEKNLKKNIYV